MQTNEKSQTANGSNGITRQPVTHLRLAGLILTALVGSLLVMWISRTTWSKVEHLQQEFTGLKAENFYLGVRMKNGIQRLNDTLLRYRLRGDQEDYDQFYVEARHLTRWFERNQSKATTPMQRKFFRQMGRSYHNYLRASTNVLNPAMDGFDRKPARSPPVTPESNINLSICWIFATRSFLRNARLLTIFSMTPKAPSADFSSCSRSPRCCCWL